MPYSKSNCSGNNIQHAEQIFIEEKPGINGIKVSIHILCGDGKNGSHHFVNVDLPAVYIIEEKLRINGIKVNIYILCGDGRNDSHHFVNVDLTAAYKGKAPKALRNAASDYETLCTQQILMNTLIPPTPHRLT